MVERPSNNGAVAALRGPGYDVTRVHVSAIFWFMAGLIVTVAVLLTILWFSQRRWLGTQRDSDRSLPAGAPPLAQPLQPSPGHPALPWEDMAALRASQMRQLQQGGPDPHNPAHTRLPIDRAINDLLRAGTLNQPWKNPSTMPFQRPPGETPRLPSVENRT